MIAVGIRQRMKTYGISRLPWPVKTPEHRWYGLGRYYAMFPAPFVTRAVKAFTQRGDAVMDPFCGRGNARFVAAALGRPAVAVAIQPVAWLFTAAKVVKERDIVAAALGHVDAAPRWVEATTRHSTWEKVQ